MITAWSAHATLIVGAKNPCDRRHISRSQVSVANWWDDQVPDQGIGVSQCLLDAASIRAVSDVQLRGNLLLGKDE
jgi:hypothetical protein